MKGARDERFGNTDGELEADSYSGRTSEFHQEPEDGSALVAVPFYVERARAPDELGGKRLEPCEVARRLAVGERVDDAVLDRFLPDHYAEVSSQHWTPIDVAVQVTRWLELLQVDSVLDLGSGVGKFCVVGALLCRRCRFIGIEQRPLLVEAARELASVFGVSEQVQFIAGRLGERDLPKVSAYYVYNPFGETLLAHDEQIDHDVERGLRRYKNDVCAAQTHFSDAPIGSCVFVYNGFGGDMPFGYEEVFVDRSLPRVLRAWRKTR